MGFDAFVSEKRCRSSVSGYPIGHEIRSVIVGDDIDIATKQVVHRYEIICVSCGMPLSEIQTPAKKTRAKRKPAEQEIVNEASA